MAGPVKGEINLDIRDSDRQFMLGVADDLHIDVEREPAATMARD